MNTGDARRDRLVGLLVEEATQGLGPEELEELESLAAEIGGGRDEFLRTAALAQLAFLSADASAQRAMPASTRARLERAAHAFVQGHRSGRPADVLSLDTRRQRAQPRRSALLPVFGLIAASVLALALLVDRIADDTGTLVPADEHARLLAEAPDVVVIPWGQSKQPGYAQVRGDVVWSNALQSGYMRLRGLPQNTPGQAQYQLWIVDPARDQHPVDGGVFDVAQEGEVIIPIDAKLRIVDPAAFAITLEQPGGVVVSDGPLLVVAAAES